MTATQVHEPRYDVDFNVASMIDDPYPTFREIRALGRAVWNDYLRGWMVTGYDDIVAAHADPGHFSSAGYPPPYFSTPTMIGADPPDHTRLRGVAKDAFTKRAVTRMRDSVVSVVDECFAADAIAEAVHTGTPFDFAAEIAAHVPTLVIADILGVSRAHRADFRQWSAELTQAVDFGVSADPELKVRQAAAAVAKVQEYFVDEIAARRAHPRDDLMSDLVLANEQGELSDGELGNMCVLLLTAGNDTTNKMISAQFLLLGQHPDERRRVLAEPALVDSAVEESLRVMTIGQATPRRVLGDVQLAGRTFTDGETAWVMKGAANRDPAQFPDPDRFDVARTPNHHLAFGWGIHLCLGVHLARMELQIVLRRLLQRLGDYEVVDFAFEPSFHVRGLDHLVLATQAA